MIEKNGNGFGGVGNTLRTSMVLWAESGDASRGVGMITRHAAALGATVRRFEDVPEYLQGEGEQVALVVVVLTAELERTLDFLNRLNQVPNRRFKVLLVKPDRSLPRSVQTFLAEVDPRSFDGIAHAAPELFQSAKKQFPSHRHVYFHNPISPPQTRPNYLERDRSLVMLSGALAAGKGFAPFYEEAWRLSADPRTSHLKVAHTGVDYTLTKTGRVGGGMQVLSALCDDVKTKKLRPGLTLPPDGDIPEAFDTLPEGSLTVFPTYTDREQNTRRISRAGVFIVPILSQRSAQEWRRQGRGKEWRKMARSGQKWGSAIEYVIFEALEAGTPILLSREYVRRMITPLVEGWPTPVYGTVKEAWQVAARLSKLPETDYRDLITAQSEFAERLRQASNRALDNLLQECYVL